MNELDETSRNKQRLADKINSVSSLPLRYKICKHSSTTFTALWHVIVRTGDTKVSHGVGERPRIVFLPLGAEKGKKEASLQHEEPGGSSNLTINRLCGNMAQIAEAVKAVIKELSERGRLSRPPCLLAVHAVKSIVGNGAVSPQKDDPVGNRSIEIGRVVPSDQKANHAMHGSQKGHHVGSQPHGEELRQGRPEGIEEIVKKGVMSRLVLVVGNRLDSGVRQRFGVAVRSGRFEDPGVHAGVIDLGNVIVIVTAAAGVIACGIAHFSWVICFVGRSYCKSAMVGLDLTVLDGSLEL